ncbi:MAG: AAA family ATPase [Candidatus Omnitrophica bacterium]|nr:AAA family ATPase [Candidatus Omnitrophota bacterium]
MYEAYWDLQEKPFENTPDPKFIYYSQQHKEALARLLYIVRERKGGTLLTGEYGSGKTLLSRVLWQELQQDHLYQSVFVLNPRLSGIEFIQEILYQLSGTEAVPNKIELFHALHKILYANNSAGKHSVIMIDEAQAIENREIFEELRLLLNFQLDNSFLLTIILLGQPELRPVVAGLPQLSQRMSVRYHLRALSEEETREYIEHRLEVAQAKRQIFDEGAFEEIFRYTSGIPRRINNICDLALLIGSGNGLSTISRKTILDIKDDIAASESGDLLNTAQRVSGDPGTQDGPGGSAPDFPEKGVGI